MVNHGFFYQVAHITVTICYIFEQSNCNKNSLLTKMSMITPHLLKYYIFTCSIMQILTDLKVLTVSS